MRIASSGPLRRPVLLAFLGGAAVASLGWLWLYPPTGERSARLAAPLAPGALDSSLVVAFRTAPGTPTARNGLATRAPPHGATASLYPPPMPDDELSLSDWTDAFLVAAIDPPPEPDPVEAPAVVDTVDDLPVPTPAGDPPQPGPLLDAPQ